MRDSQNQEMLDQLADALVDDLFSASDEEIAQEAKEDRAFNEVVFEKIFNDAKKIVGLRRLAAAHAAVRAYQNQSRPLIRIEPEEARRRVLNAISNDNTLRITSAARNGTELNDDDAISLFFDFMEIGIIKDGTHD